MSKSRHNLRDKKTGRFARHPYTHMFQVIMKITADLARTQIYEFGKYVPYFKFIDFPVDITQEIKIGGN